MSKGFYSVLVAILRFPLFLYFRYKLINKNNIPKEGRYIIAANHISGPDCIFVGLGQKRCIRFMAKAELFDNKLLAWFFTKMGAFPVNRGKGDTSAIENAKEMVENGEVLGIFIEGTRSKTGEFLKPKSGAVMIAHQMNCKIIPCAISCKGLKASFWRRKYVHFGDPVTCEELGITKASPREYRDASRKLMDIFAELRKQDIGC
ncbi:MAG: 1-acyl-sn-glycerol-3-phosphate acyltransferase [Ruminococcaceae bacterium]|nr:1-acyl-sn-glycerol-3-phosphate acyltransferase [Oscillospiraceae bacterium]